MARVWRGPNPGLTQSVDNQAAARVCEWIQGRIPEGGLFAGQTWRISPEPFFLTRAEVAELDQLGRVFLQFYKALNLLHRQSLAGKLPEWPARWLDAGKPASMLAWQAHPAFKNEVPRVIRPDILLTDEGFKVSELDSVPGGIGLTAWLNEVYASAPDLEADQRDRVLGGATGMLEGFGSIFGDAPRVRMVVSEESATYRPEMEWLARKLGGSRFVVQDGGRTDFEDGDAIYRFFELFDLANVPGAETILRLASEKRARLTPPPKPLFEEKLTAALLWNGNLKEFWRRELGGRFYETLLKLTPMSWVVDPTPLPPHGAIPWLNLTDWGQLKTMTQKERDLILKISGFSPNAWGARGVHLGSDMPAAEWGKVVDEALAGFAENPWILQRYHKPKVSPARWYDFAATEFRPMEGRVRLCPYYFVSGEGDAMRAKLCGALATICPVDKKIIHGMTDAILAPVATRD